MKPFKIQNRSATSRRVKFIRNGGDVAFTTDQPSYFIINTREAGFCLNPATPLKVLDGAINTIYLTAHPMGTDGRVTVFKDGELLSSLRYVDLAKIADRQNWFNEHFSPALTYTGRTLAAFEVTDPDPLYQLVFEDDDLDYEFAEVTQAVDKPHNDTLQIEQYRLAFNLVNNEIPSNGVVVRAPYQLKLEVLPSDTENLD